MSIGLLVIGGSDTSSGAGIQSDLKASCICNVYAYTAITCVTSQNSFGVQSIYALDPEIIIDQICTVLDDYVVQAIKIGMIGNANGLEAILKCLSHYPEVPLIVDPVFHSKNGTVLWLEKKPGDLIKKLFPKTFLLTPNIQEAHWLTREKIDDQEQVKKALNTIYSMGPRYVLLKGWKKNHQRIYDILYDGKTYYWINHPQYHLPPIHGTGCFLASLIASMIAQGYDMVSSLDHAYRLFKNHLLHYQQNGKSLLANISINQEV